ncbi:MAG: NAD(P)-binding domain-containing protein [Woeseiaceae bacterium]
MRQVMQSVLAFFPAVFAVLLMSGIEMAAAQSEPLKIGIIGTGRIGGALARHWVRAGHEVFMSSRHPEEFEGLAEELGPGRTPECRTKPPHSVRSCWYPYRTR